MDVVKELVAGTVGGVAGIFAGQPFDTVKVRLQADPNSVWYKGPWDCVKKTWTNEGILGFYKGMLSPIVANAPINALLFAVESEAQKRLDEAPDRLGTTAKHMLAGSISGFCQTIFAGPSELIKIRLQVEREAKQPRYRGPWECAKYIHNQSGFGGFFRGMGLTILRDTPAFGIYFLTYHTVKGWFKQRQEADNLGSAAVPTKRHSALEDPTIGIIGAPSANDAYSAHAQHSSGTASATDNVSLGTLPLLLAGGLAGTMSWLVLHPIDVCKSLYQSRDVSLPANERNLVPILRNYYRTEGIKFLFRGLTSTCIRAFPVSAVTFAVYEYTAYHIENVMEDD